MLLRLALAVPWAGAWSLGTPRWTEEVAWCLDGVDAGWTTDVSAAFDAWAEAASCTDLVFRALGDCASAPEATLRVSVVPGGVTGACSPPCDLVLDAELPLASTATIEGGGCTEELSREAWVGQEVGRLLGLGNACTAEGCPDPYERQALMGELSVCEVRAPNVDDYEGLLARYGGRPVIRSYEEVFGVLPTQACFTLEGSVGQPEVADVFWNFGDDTSATGLEACHTWSAEGQYDVIAAWTYSASCGGYLRDAVVASVAACGPPHAVGDAAFFTLEDLAGTTIRLSSGVDRSVPGCVEALFWAVLQEDGEVFATGEGEVWEVEVPAGTWRVTLLAVGPAGQTLGQMDVLRTAGGGSEPEQGGCGGSAVAVVALASLRWRTRRGVVSHRHPSPWSLP